MKTVLILASLAALAVAGTVPPQPEYTTTTVDAQFIELNKKVLSLLEYPYQIDTEAEYYKIGKDCDLEAHINDYTDKKAVEDFLYMYKDGFLPKKQVFSVLKERMLKEAIAMFKLFYYAKDFETFYKTAACARVHANEGQFAYAYYLAVLHRPDTQGIVLPAPYEVSPQFYVNTEVIAKMYHVKMTNGLSHPESAYPYGIVKENDKYIFYANYSNHLTYTDGEERLSYLTEDIGWNSYYYYFNLYFPFWMKGDHFSAMKEYRGASFYYYFQRVLARYYLERLSNGLGEIPEFSWYYPIKNGYKPLLYKKFPFAQRPEYYRIPFESHTQDRQFLDNYEETFLTFLHSGHFKAYGQEIDLHNSASQNFIGNFWQSNADLYEKTGPRKFYHNYELTARRLLSAASEYDDEYTLMPSALSFYQTSMRDPMFYQLYSRMLKYFIQYKQYLEPYTPENLRYVGVKINDVTVEKLSTYFDLFDFEASNALYFSPEERKTTFPYYGVRQPRLNHQPFSVNINVKADTANEAVVKIFLGPKYDSKGLPIKFEDNWMNFYLVDWFTYNLTAGINAIVRHSKEFNTFQDDYVSYRQLYKLFDQGKVPTDMHTKFEHMPNRLMLPKGTKGGFPLQFFVMVYPYSAHTGEMAEKFSTIAIDKKPLGYPLDRPLSSPYHFKQPNMFFKDAYVYHEGEEFSYKYNIPGYEPRNEVPKH